MTIYFEDHSIELEADCGSCEGTGSEWKNGKSRDCSICLGTGSLPSAAGETLLEFIRKYGR
jgi:hypothetical protein